MFFFFGWNHKSCSNAYINGRKFEMDRRTLLKKTDWFRGAGVVVVGGGVIGDGVVGGAHPGR